MSSDSEVSSAPKDVGLPPLGYIVPPVILSNASRTDVYSFLIAYYEAYFHKDGSPGFCTANQVLRELYAMAACPHEEVMTLRQRNRDKPVMANKKKRRCTSSSSSKGKVLSSSSSSSYSSSSSSSTSSSAS